MFQMPDASQLAGFNNNQVQSYLTSPSFQTNTTLGGLLGAGGLSGVSSLGAGLNPTSAGGGIFGSTSGSAFGGMDGLKLLVGGIGTIGNLWNAFQAQKLAKEQFQFTKDFSNINLANQIKSYNTALSDRAVSRGFTQGDDQAKTDAYIAENSLEKRKV
jgi:hypothetical protein